MQETIVPLGVPGRRCRYLGCVTVLSIYNFDVLCWTHADEMARTSFDRRLAKIGNERFPVRPKAIGMRSEDRWTRHEQRVPGQMR